MQFFKKSAQFQSQLNKQVDFEQAGIDGNFTVIDSHTAPEAAAPAIAFFAAHPEDGNGVTHYSYSFDAETQPQRSMELMQPELISAATPQEAAPADVIVIDSAVDAEATATAIAFFAAHPEDGNGVTHYAYTFDAETLPLHGPEGALENVILLDTAVNADAAAPAIAFFASHSEDGSGVMHYAYADSSASDNTAFLVSIEHPIGLIAVTDVQVF